MVSSGPDVKHQRVQGRVRLEKLTVKALRKTLEVRTACLAHWIDIDDWRNSCFNCYVARHRQNWFYPAKMLCGVSCLWPRRRTLSTMLPRCHL